MKKMPDKIKACGLCPFFWSHTPDQIHTQFLCRLLGDYIDDQDEPEKTIDVDCPLEDCDE